MKNKFITFIILWILWVIWAGIYNAYFFNKADRNSFVILIEWTAFLNNNALKIDERMKLDIWDRVFTEWKESLVVIEWWDGSLTRLGGNSSIELNELYITHDLSKMNISFRLLSGKSWSNVISFFWDESYFKEYFMDSEASVRGTVFDVDLEKEYIYVLDHEITLTSWEWKDSIIISERNPFSLQTFSFMKLEKFIREIKDKTWQNLNNSFDQEYFDTLKQEAINALEDNIFVEKFEDILNSEDLEKMLWSLSKDKKSELYNKLLAEYQKINFVRSEDGDLFEIKIKLKEALLATASPNNKKVLLQSTLYDFKELIRSKNYDMINSILPILERNKDLLKELNIQFLDYFNFEILPEDLKKIMLNNLETLTNIFGQSIDFTKFKNMSVDDLKWALSSFKDSSDNFIHWVLDSALESLINK